MSDDDMIRRGAVLDILDLAEHDAEERDWRSGANEIAALRKRVTAIPALPAAAVGVKQLKWSQIGGDFFADVPYGKLCIVKARKRGFWTLGMFERYSDHPSLEAAQAAAQADYEASILSVLKWIQTVSPHATAKVQALVDALEGVMTHEPDHSDTLWQNAREALAAWKDATK